MMNINENKWIEKMWPMTEYFGLLHDGGVASLGSFDCYDDLEYDVDLDVYAYVWTKKNFTQLLSYGVMLLGENND